jgi:hypothetical protein
VDRLRVAWVRLQEIIEENGFDSVGDGGKGAWLDFARHCTSFESLIVERVGRAATLPEARELRCRQR